MIAALSIMVPAASTILRSQAAGAGLHVVRTCDACGTSSNDRGSAYCQHSCCPLRNASEQERLNDGSKNACQPGKSTGIAVSCLKTEQPIQV